MRDKKEILPGTQSIAMKGSPDFTAINELLYLLLEVQIDTRDQLTKLTDIIGSASTIGYKKS